MSVIRAIVAVIVGYVALVCAVFALLTASWMILGADGAFEPGTYQQSPTWLVVASVAGLIAAIIGGLVCALIAVKKSKAPTVLLCIVLILGILELVVNLTSDRGEPLPRTGSVTMTQAIEQAQPPIVFLIIMPIVGAIGVGIGARISGRGGTPTTV
jgi:hypothetical protein